MGSRRPAKKRLTTVIVNEYGDVSFNQFFFLLPEHLFPWFLVPINSPHAVSSRKNQGQQCRITKSIDEQSKAFSLSNHIFVFYISLILSSNAGNNLKAKRQSPTVTTMSNCLSHPGLCQCLYSYTGTSPSATGQIVRVTGQTNVVAVVSAVPTTSSTPTKPKPSSSSNGPNVAA